LTKGSEGRKISDRFIFLSFNLSVFFFLCEQSGRIRIRAWAAFVVAWTQVHAIMPRGLLLSGPDIE
jgi:hypothetical protein